MRFLREPSTYILAMLGGSIALDIEVNGFATQMARALGELAAQAWHADPVTFTMLGFAWAFGFMGLVLTLTAILHACDERAERRYTAAALMVFCGVAFGLLSGVLFHAFV